MSMRATPSPEEIERLAEEVLDVVAILDIGGRPDQKGVEVVRRAASILRFHAAALRERDDYRERWNALSTALVGETGASAILTATSLRRERDEARRMLAEADAAIAWLLSEEHSADAATHIREGCIRHASRLAAAKEKPSTRRAVEGAIEASKNPGKWERPDG